MRTSCSLGVLVVLAGAAAAGCSAIVSPDTSRLGPGSDGGLDPTLDGGPGLDGGPIVATDGGVMPDVDGGPIGSDSGTPDSGPICVEGCTGGVVTTCVGGVARTEPCALGCAASGAACAEMVPSNVEPGLWIAEAGDVTIDGTAGFDTSTCMSMLTRSEVVDQAGGPAVCVYQVRDLTITEGSSLRIVGSRPLVIMATGDVEIDGVLDVSAQLEVPGPGGGSGGRPGSLGGVGAAPGAGGTHAGSLDDSGGGGGGFCGAGGAGGRGGTASGAAGGARVDPTMLIPLRGGSGGGAGNGSTWSSGTTLGTGGAAGGAVQISAQGRIRIRGAIAAGGGGGRGGQTSSGGNWGSGGGGGSGGGILLEAPEVVFEGGSGLGATGGGGGGSASSGGAGGAGEDGRTTLAPATGGAAGGSMYGAPGGDSGGGATIDAMVGGSNATSGANGGGGGGGAGCIVVRTASGTLPAGTIDAWSPSAEGVAVARVLTR